MNRVASDQFLQATYADQDAYWRGVRYRGRVCVQSPLDLWVMGEIVQETKPDLIVETGSFRGGTALYLAELCELEKRGRVVSIDVDVIHEWHEGWAEFWRGSSTDPALVERALRGPSERVMVTLDSDHHAEHVLAELELWAPHVTPGCYLVVQDTLLSTLDPSFGPGPGEALAAWLPEHPEFEVDHWRDRFGASFHRGGWLRRLET